MKITTNSNLTGILYDPVYKLHAPRYGHPEAPERCDAAMAGVQEYVAIDRLLEITQRPATVDELALCHTRAYIEKVKHDVAAGYGSLSTGDTDICAESFDVACRAVGGVLNAVDLVCAQKIRNAFCIVRPPGHHATPDTGMGFCIFNNIAIAARYAQRKYNIDRVLVADWDIHHGNGTQEIFYSDPSVFYFSTHQWPFFPGTGLTDQAGAGPGKGATLNCPLAAGSSGIDVLSAFRRKLIPRMRTFKPQLVLVSAGFDARIHDPIGQMILRDRDFEALTEIMMEIAAIYADDRLVSVLEGGYQLAGLQAATGAHAARLTR